MKEAATAVPDPVREEGSGFGVEFGTDGDGDGDGRGEGVGERDIELGSGPDVGTADRRRARLDPAPRSRDGGTGRGAADDARRPPRGRSSRLRVDPAELLARAVPASAVRVEDGVRRGERVHTEEVVLPDGAVHAEDAVRTGDTVRTEDGAALVSRLRRLSRAGDLTRSELVEVLVRFDELELWRAAGARSCVAWQIVELGASRSLAYENLKVGRALKGLPVIAKLFRTGELSFSKVRALVNVAVPEDETALAVMALDADADTVLRRCDEYRWGREAASETDDAERERARFERRSLVHSRLPDGSSASRLVLPPDSAELVAAAVEHRVERRIREARAAGGFEALPDLRQMRADALVEIVQASLMKDPDAPSAPVTDLVVAVVDAEALESSQAEVAARGPDDERPLPLPLRAAIDGILRGSIAPSTARRMACSGTLVTAIVEGGEPVAMGRKTRLHTPSQRRAVIVRDGAVCAFPGCGRTTNLEPHHVLDWAWGGATDVRETVSLCRSGCHQRVHDEGWIITRIGDDEPVERHARGAELLDGADERTRALVTKLDARRPKYRFELPTGTRAGAESGSRSAPRPGSACCAESGPGVHVADIAPGKPGRDVHPHAAEAKPLEYASDADELESGGHRRDDRGTYGGGAHVPAASTTRHASSKRYSCRLFPVPPTRSTTANSAGADNGVSTPCQVPRR